LLSSEQERQSYRRWKTLQGLGRLLANLSCIVFESLDQDRNCRLPWRSNEPTVPAASARTTAARSFIALTMAGKISVEISCQNGRAINAPIRTVASGLDSCSRSAGMMILASSLSCASRKRRESAAFPSTFSRSSRTELPLVPRLENSIERRRRQSACLYRYFAFWRGGPGRFLQWPILSADRHRPASGRWQTASRPADFFSAVQ